MVVVVAAFAFGALTAALAVFGLTVNEWRDGSAAGWSETAWPFPKDLWSPGKAFRCSAARCGTEVRVFVRTKDGLCSCTAPIADDDDVDRMGDIELVAEKLTPLQPSRPVKVGPMRGRSRIYDLGPRNAMGRSAIAVAVKDRCDMIVATVVLQHDGAASYETEAVAFLNSASVLRWIEVTIGL
jgi:hypothetical protein